MVGSAFHNGPELLKLLYRITVAIDRTLATAEERRATRYRALYAATMYGADAYGRLERKLRDPRRRESRREIRLAVAELLKA